MRRDVTVDDKQFQFSPASLFSPHISLTDHSSLSARDATSARRRNECWRTHVPLATAVHHPGFRPLDVLLSRKSSSIEFVG